MKNVWYYEFPIGRISVACDETGITDVAMGEIEAKEEENHLIHKAAKQLEEYFIGRRQKFDLPLSLKGTPFQQNVWRELMRIPYGETRSYGQIAEMIGNPRACRAVGMANNRNKIIIIIPCHRVIGADGSLVGYGGGVKVKKKLLELERKFK